MKQLWAETEAEVAKLNKDRDEKVEDLLERFAEEKFNSMADIKNKYDLQIGKVAKKPLPGKLKEKMLSKLKKEKEDQVAKMANALEMKKKEQIEEIKVEYEGKRRASVKGSQIEKTMARMKSLSKNTPSKRSNSIKSKRPSPPKPARFPAFNPGRDIYPEMPPALENQINLSNLSRASPLLPGKVSQWSNV